MKPELSADLTLSQVVRHYPESINVFSSHGLKKLVTGDGLRALAPFLTLGAALRSRDMDADSFLKALKAATDSRERLEAPGLEEYGEQGDLSLLALMPCGLKMPFSRAVTGFLDDLKRSEGLEIRYAVEGNLNQEISYYSYIYTIETIEELPDIIFSADFNSFYSHSFYEKFVATGLLTGYGDFRPGAAFRKAGILDPQSQYTILGVNPLVIVANLDEIGDRPLPTCWEDVLHPMWKDSITLRGGDGFFCHAVLLPTYKRFGEDGLLKLADNVFRGLHPAQMVQQIDSGGPGALYVMPEFFARRAGHQERIKIIWPEDGALASPVTLQVKPDRIEELKPVLDFLTGEELARILVGARFPVPHEDVEGGVQEKPLLWLGWDYLRENDLAALNEEIDRIFLPAAGDP